MTPRNAFGAGGLVMLSAWLASVFGPDTIGGIARDEVLMGLVFAAALLGLTGWAVERARAPGWRPAIAAVGLWTILLAATSGLYVQRGAMLAALRPLAGADWLEPAAEIAAGGGEVAVRRGHGGHFKVPARINGRDVSFVFDTGASTVVLTAETAERIGIRTDAIRYRVPVSTANGTALAAPLSIAELSVGSITARRVPALIVRSGLLSDNLLGQSFLDRLDSYEVRADRLVLRARKA